MFNKNKLAQALEDKNWSAYKLWKVSGVSQSVISDIMNGKVKNPTAKTLSKLADALGVSVNDFFDDEPKKQEKSNKHVLPIEFTTPEEAMQFILEQPAIMGFGGFNPDKMSDDEKRVFTKNRILKIRFPPSAPT